MEGNLGRSVAWLCAFVSGIAAEAQDEGRLERVGERFRVVLHRADLADVLAARIADEAAATVEKLWPIVSEMVGARPKGLHEIHLYRDQEEYREVERASSPVGFQSDTFVTRDGVGHVWANPQLDRALLEHVGLSRMTREALLWVAAQQVIAPVVPDTEIEDWVKWTLVVAAVEAVTCPGHALGVDYAHDRRRASIADWRREEADVSLARLVEYVPKPKSVDDSAWVEGILAVVAQTMAAADDKWAKKLLRKHRLPRDQKGLAALQRAAAKAVFGSNWRKAEAIYEQIMAAEQTTLVLAAPVCQPASGRTLLVGTAQDPAIAVVRRALLASGRYAIEGRIELGPYPEGGNTAAGFMFETSDEGCVSAGFSEREAWIKDWDTQRNQWKTLSYVGITIARGEPFDFRVEVTEQDVRLFVGGMPAGAWKHDGRLRSDYARFQVNDRIVWIDQVKVVELAR